MSSSKIAESDSGAEDDIAPVHVYVVIHLHCCHPSESTLIVFLNILLPYVLFSLPLTITVNLFNAVNIEKNQKAKLIQVEESS